MYKAATQFENSDFYRAGNQTLWVNPQSADRLEKWSIARRETEKHAADTAKTGEKQ